ncbi:unnamed protein product [Rhodiola kirilowii]
MKYVKPVALFHELLSSKAGKKGRLIGLDVGNKYVGLAVSEPCRKIASPFSVLLRKKSNIGDMAEDFQTMCSNSALMNADTEIFSCGTCRRLPAGYAADQSRLQVKIFIDDLSKTEQLEGVKYTYWDESFTSKGVEMLINSVEMRPLEHKTAIDKFAAVKILQEYLDQMNIISKAQKKSETQSSEAEGLDNIMSSIEGI